MVEKLRYVDLTEPEKTAIVNGCGPKGGNIPVPEFIFTASCDHHDFNYWLGCMEEDRHKADKQFYNAMKEDCDALKNHRALGRIMYFRYRVWSWLYYKAVRHFGNHYFHYADKERTRSDIPI